MFRESSSILCAQLRDQFLKKVQFCATPFDLNDDSRHTKEKNERLNYLHELGDYLTDQNCVVSVIIPHIDLVIEMIEKNIFRPLPVLKKAGPPGEGVGMDEVLPMVY
jgi:serine/threonine-protein phosphatase 2A regulatory subunit B'